MKAAKKTKRTRRHADSYRRPRNEADAEKAGLSPFNSVTVTANTILGAIEHLASVAGIKASSTDPEVWRATARNTGTHTLKMMDSKDRQQRIRKMLGLRSR